MSKKSFKDIEQIIINAAEANEPAFDEQSWKKMEALLDKEKDRKRPFVFWLWWFIPLLLGSAAISYFAFNNTGKENKQEQIANEKINNSAAEMPKGEIEDLTEGQPNSVSTEGLKNSTGIKEKPEKRNDKNGNSSVPINLNSGNSVTVSPAAKLQNADDKLNAKRNPGDKLNGKMTAGIKASVPVSDYESNEVKLNNSHPDIVKTDLSDSLKTEEIMVIGIDADKANEKEIEKILDSVAKKINADKKPKNKIARLYIIAAAGAEANGVKLFATDKITSRIGLGVGYNLNKHFSIQTGFYVSSKKYGATGNDYKTKPGSYWNTVDIKSIEANCKVYEIPISVLYNFTAGKKLNIFAAAGLSSYIMKKEDYHLSYDHYGTIYQADTYYKGNKNLFSVLRLSAGIEKKINKRFSVIASPGVAIPLSGVGEGEVKLFSADIMIGLKFFPFQKK